MAIIIEQQKTYEQEVADLTNNERAVLWAYLRHTEDNDRYFRPRRTTSPIADISPFIHSETSTVPHKQIWTALDGLVKKGWVTLTPKGETITLYYRGGLKECPIAEVEARSRRAGSGYYSNDRVNPHVLYDVTVPRKDEILALVEAERAEMRRQADAEKIAKRESAEAKEASKAARLLDACRLYVDRYGDGSSPVSDTDDSYIRYEIDYLVREIESASKDMQSWVYQRSEIDRDAERAENDR